MACVFSGDSAKNEICLMCLEVRMKKAGYV